jgi:hypothetical protein
VLLLLASVASARAAEPLPEPSPSAPTPNEVPPSPPTSPSSRDALDALTDTPLVDTPSSAPAGGASSLLNPRISLIGTFAGAYFDGTPTVGGGHEASGSGLTLQELELAIQATVDPYWTAEAYSSFSLDGVEVEEAFARTTALPVVAISAGKLRSRLGRHNRRHLEQWRFADQPLVAKALLGSEGMAPLGVAFEMLPPIDVSLNIRLEILDARGVQAHAHEEPAPADAAEPAFGDRAAGMARVELGVGAGAATSLLFGVSGLVTGRGDALRGMVGGDFYLRYLPAVDSFFAVAWQTEYLAEITRKHTTGGLYTELGLRLGRRFEVAGRFDRAGFPEGEITREAGGALALTFLPTEFSRVRLQGGASKRAGKDDPIVSVLLQLQFNVGPHGAHAF